MACDCGCCAKVIEDYALCGVAGYALAFFGKKWINYIKDWLFSREKNAFKTN